MELDARKQILMNKARLDHFFRGQISSSFLALLIPILLLFSYLKDFSLNQYVWFSLYVFGFIVRISTALAYLHITKSPFENLTLEKILRYETVFIFSIIPMALSSGLTFWALDPISGGGKILIPVIVPITVIVLGLNKMNASIKGAISYIFFTTTPYVYCLTIGFPDISPVLLPLVAVYGLYLVSTAKTNYKNFLDLQFSVLELKRKVEIEEELKNQRMATIQSGKMASIGEMAGGMAHEINNPLAIIKFNTHLFAKELRENNINDPKFFKRLETISNTTDRIGRIVRSLLLISKKQDQDEKVTCKLSEILGEVTNLVGEKFKAEGIEFNIDFDEDYEVLVNKVSLIQVILALLNNSFYFIQKQPNAWVKFFIVSVSSFELEFYIQDSGPPLSKEVQEKLFTPFYSTKPVGEGTGLGLSTSKSMMTNMDGDLNFIETSHPTFVLKIQRLKKDQILKKLAG